MQNIVRLTLLTLITTKLFCMLDTKNFDKCCICLEELKHPVIVLACCHCFCERCINGWRRKNPVNCRCPLCKTSIPALESSVGSWAPGVQLLGGDEHFGDEIRHCCCNMRRFKSGCALHCSSYEQASPCDPFAAIYFFGTLGCCCSCLDTNGRIIPCVHLVRCATCQFDRRLSDIDSGLYLCCEGSMSCALMYALAAAVATS